MARVPTAQTTPSNLASEVVAATAEVRGAFMDLLAALPPASRPVDLSRSLGIDYTMSRKAMLIAEATDLFEIAVEVPRPAALPRILKASASKGVEAETLGRLERAIENFESLAKRHGGDRPTFDAMIAAMSPGSADRVRLEAKRSAYRANTQLFGRQVDTTVFFIAVRPSAQQEGYFDSVWICAQLGLKRFHPSASLEAITTRFSVELPGGPTDWPTAPLKIEGASTSNTFLIEEFCSKPLPRIKQLPEVFEGFRRFEFESDEIGLRSAVDCVTAQVVRSPWPRPTRDGFGYFGMQSYLDIPAGALLMDIFAHESVLADAPALCVTASNSIPSLELIPNHPDPSILLPSGVAAQDMGRGTEVARTKETPRYDRLIRHAFEKMGWSDPESHRLIRCRVEYPILNTHTVLRVPIRVKG